MNYFSGGVGLASITVAQTLPADQLLWLVARVLLDVAGGLFLLYLLAVGGVTAAAALSPRRRPLSAEVLAEHGLAPVRHRHQVAP